MSNPEKTVKDRKNMHKKQNPSFSSTLLDQIYRSIDADADELTLRRETPAKNQSMSLSEACLLDKWVEKNSREKISLRKSSILDHDFDRHDALFFSSGSNSSETSSGGLSSSDAELFDNPKPTASCFSRPKPIRVGSEKTETALLFNTQKSKSRVLKIYGNLKNLKQPISPGGKLSSLINSIFAGNGNKSENPSLAGEIRKQRTCSSASSFSRSCLSKNPPVSRENRTVRFSPASSTVNEDHRQHKTHESKPKSESVPNLKHSEIKFKAMEKTTKDLLRQHRQKQSKISVCDRYEDDEEDDDVASCASSDLFELDHLAVVRDKYDEELPVYETTRFDRNRPISNSKSNPK